MPKIIVLPHAELCPQGKVIEAEVGEIVIYALLRNNIKIEHACEMSCACTTCHVVVREGFSLLNPASEKEEDMLDKAWGLESNSRLSCQTKMPDRDIRIEIPKYTINLASEGH